MRITFDLPGELVCHLKARAIGWWASTPFSPGFR
jgi:hypothetical protein